MAEAAAQNHTAPAVLDCLARSTDGLQFQGPARSVTLPTANGQVQVMPGHAEAFIVMTAGRLVFEGFGGQPDRSLAIRSGTLLVKDNQVTVLV